MWGALPRRMRAASRANRPAKAPPVRIAVRIHRARARRVRLGKAGGRNHRPFGRVARGPELCPWIADSGALRRCRCGTASWPRESRRPNTIRATKISKRPRTMAGVAWQLFAALASSCCRETAIRYEIASSGPDGLQYRVGLWKQHWADGRLARFEPIEETLGQFAPAALSGRNGGVVRRHGFVPAANAARRAVLARRAWIPLAESTCTATRESRWAISMATDGTKCTFASRAACRTGCTGAAATAAWRTSPKKPASASWTTALAHCSSIFATPDIRIWWWSPLTQPLLFLNQGDGTFRHKPDAFRFQSPRARHLHRNRRRRLRPGRPGGPVPLHLYLLPERRPIPLSGPVLRLAERPAQFPLPQRPDGRGRRPLRGCHRERRHDRRTTTGTVSRRPGATTTATAGRIFMSPMISGATICIEIRAAVSGMWRRRRVSPIVGPGMSAAWFDYDGDGRPDLYVSNMWTACGQRIVEDQAFAAAAERQRSATRIAGTPKATHSIAIAATGTFECPRRCRGRGDGPMGVG